jgi:subtilisin family serine protease
LRLIYTMATGLLLTGMLSAAPAYDYLPGKMQVRFFEHPEINITDGKLSLGIPDLDKINQDFDLLDVSMVSRYPDRVSMPDVRLNYMLEFAGEPDMEVLKALYESTGLIEYAEPEYLMPIYRTPNDPSTGSQWFLTKVEAYEAWDLIPETPDNPDMIVAILDTGVQWNHPDLTDQIWINPGEDLDGNGAMAPGTTPGELFERNNVDDDDNEYVDDFYGYDWVDGPTGCAAGEDCNTEDNNPMDFEGHGTHCSGLAAAATDNAVGIASVAWDSRIMCLRVGYAASDGGGYVIPSAVANAIEYAYHNGASIISMSFGGSASGRTWANAAWSAGCICFHAAGNDNIANQDQLDRATGMVSVASSTSNDCKSGFSNYGSWIDVIAPGSSMYSTVPVFQGSYATLDGTSMACPTAASVTALLWWNNPELSNAEIRTRLLATTDNIYHLGCNSSYEAEMQLGVGRVNAYNALAEIFQATYVELDDVVLRDSGADGRYLEGENIEVVLDYSVTGFNSTGVGTMTISSDDPGLNIVNAVTDLPALNSEDSWTNDESPALIAIISNDPRYVQLSVEVEFDNVEEVYEFEFEIMVGPADILLYDDDLSSPSLPVYTYYYKALKELDMIFDWYSTAETGFPQFPEAELSAQDYNWAIYASGQNASTMDEAEQQIFSDFVNAGQHLIVSSTNLDQDIPESTFFSDVLRAELGESTSGSTLIYGTNHGITDDVSVMLLGAGGAQNQVLPITEVRAQAGSTSELFLDNGLAFPIGIHSGYGANRVVYLNFCLEAASGIGGTMSAPEVIEILMSYLDGTDIATELKSPVSHQLKGNYPNPFNPTTIIEYELQANADVVLAIYNVNGQQIEMLVNDKQTPGLYNLDFNASQLSSGLYFARLSIDGQLVYTHKMLLVK